jgi:hypothetical protein
MLFPSSAAMFWDCAGHSKPCEKQVTMIAQKIVDANHAQQ